jgi:hypothetical protein
MRRRVLPILFAAAAVLLLIVFLLAARMESWLLRLHGAH